MSTAHRQAAAEFLLVRSLVEDHQAENPPSASSKRERRLDERDGDEGESELRRAK